MIHNKEHGKIYHDFFLRIVKFLDMLMLTAVFGYVWVFYYNPLTWDPFFYWGNWVFVFLYLLLIILCGRVYDAFLVSYNRISEMVYSQMLAIVVADTFTYFVILLLTKGIPQVWPMLLTALAQGVVATVWSVFAHTWYFHNFKAKRTIVVSDESHGLEKLLADSELVKKFDVKASVTSKEFITHSKKYQDTEVVFISGVSSHLRNKIIKYCVYKGIGIFVLPKLGDILMSGATPMHMFHLPLMRLGQYNPTPEYVVFKRACDIVFSAIGLIVLSPILLITAICIKTDGGPVFYTQTRMTQGGRKFKLIKFRSMKEDAEKDGVARLSTGENDDRITKVGRFIRKIRLDELPQLFNILLGDMSFVGPRPERPEIAAQYEKEMPEFHLRLQAKAGLTGYAQVYGKYNSTPYEKLQMDLMYLAKPGIAQDLRIVFATIKILFLPESTEGVDEGQVTAEKNR